MTVFTNSNNTKYRYQKEAILSVLWLLVVLSGCNAPITCDGLGFEHMVWWNSIYTGPYSTIHIRGDTIFYRPPTNDSSRAPKWLPPEVLAQHDSGYKEYWQKASDSVYLINRWNGKRLFYGMIDRVDTVHSVHAPNHVDYPMEVITEDRKYSVYHIPSKSSFGYDDIRWIIQWKPLRWERNEYFFGFRDKRTGNKYCFRINGCQQSPASWGPYALLDSSHILVHFTLEKEYRTESYFGLFMMDLQNLIRCEEKDLLINETQLLNLIEPEFRKKN